jgi:hypothetical protein
MRSTSKRTYESKPRDKKRFVVILTTKEWGALKSMVGNGWGGGDFSGYGGENPATQKRAMDKFGLPIECEIGDTIKI